MILFKNKENIVSFIKMFTLIYLTTLPLVFLSLYTFKLLFSYAEVESYYLYLGLYLISLYVPSLFGIVIATYLLKANLPFFKALFITILSYIVSLPFFFIGALVASFVVVIMGIIDMIFPGWLLIDLSGYFSIAVLSLPTSIILAVGITSFLRQRIKVKAGTIDEIKWLPYLSAPVLVVVFAYLYQNPPEFLTLLVPFEKKGLVGIMYWIYICFPIEVAIITLLLLREAKKLFQLTRS